MHSDSKVELWEDTIVRDANGQIEHHPLNGLYVSGSGKDGASYGYLTFGGHNLAESLLLDDVRVFLLFFYGESDSEREAWADPLRIKVLQRISSEERVWYLSFVGDVPDTSTSTGYVPIGQELQCGLLKEEKLSSTVVQSENPAHCGKGFTPRLFFEVPNRLLPHLVNRYWSRAYPGFPIEGYALPSGRIDLLHEWDRRPRDEQLFRDVIDEVFVAFYTFPAENRHFVFVTNKVSLDDMKRLLDLDELQRRAEELERQAGASVETTT